jgi:thioredoxin 1
MTEALDIDADDWDAEVNRSSAPVLVDFWHDACIWCKHLDPVYSQLAGEFSDKLKFAKLNVLSNERNSQLAAKFGVMGTPTVILFCKGRPIETLVGYRPKETLKRELELMIETQQDCFKQQTPLVK